MLRMNLIGAVGAIAWICMVTSPAQADLFRVGRLVCSADARVGLIVGSTQSLRCVFHNTRPARQYIYAGRISRMGLDIGLTQGGVLSWAVLAKNSRIGRATMRGTYVGASGHVALGPGLGANVLIGGSRRSVVLQPLSVELSVGINLAIGVTRLTLGSGGRQ
ncbi:DUF992 domain-containing protein [Nitrobacter sp. TKz-YC01]